MKPRDEDAGGKDKSDLPPFRYSVELVASVAVHFANGVQNDREAAERAIRLLDAVGETIRCKRVWMRAQLEAEKLSEQFPKRTKFGGGIRLITGRRTETEAAKPFREHLRLHLRLHRLGRPSWLTDEQVRALLAPVSDDVQVREEESEIETIEARFRQKGFNQVELITMKQEFDFLNEQIVRPRVNAEKGRKGAEAKKLKKALGAVPKKKK